MLSKKPRKRALWCSAFPSQVKGVKTSPRPRYGSKKAIPARKAVRKVSVSRQKERYDYRKQKAAFMFRQPFCQVCFKEKAIDVHHIRGTFKARLNDEKWWMSVCRVCHDFIHAHPSWSYARGYLVIRSGKEPNDAPTAQNQVS